MKTEKSANKEKGKNQTVKNGWHSETKALHAGWHSKQPGDPAIAPWQPSTVFRHPETGLSTENWSYTRLDNPNRNQLERTLASIEGGTSAIAYASGMAAVQAVFQCFSPGDHILLPDDLYHGVRNLALNHYQKWGLSFDFVDMTNPKAVEEASNEKTRLLWLETPSNPMLQISDLRKLASLAKEKGWTSIVDNTWSTPVIQRPLDFGIDLVLYSTTKYLGGHSDILGGAVIVGDHAAKFEPMLRSIQKQAGAVPSAFDCWLLARSLKTLFPRIRQQVFNAKRIAEQLNGHPGVKKVFYPGLKSHSGYDISEKQTFLPGAMISFLVEGDKNDALRVVSSAELIQPATSLGGVESLWEHRKTSEYPESPTPDTLIRLSVGIENWEDIMADILQSLGKIQSK